MDYLNTAKEGHADIQDDDDDENSVMRTIMTSLTIMTTKTQITMPKKKKKTKTNTDAGVSIISKNGVFFIKAHIRGLSFFYKYGKIRFL